MARLSDALPAAPAPPPPPAGHRPGPRRAAGAGRRPRRRRSRGSSATRRRRRWASWSSRRRSSSAAGPAASGRPPRPPCCAMEAARRGRRAAVVTIDPARRLANAMGLEGLSNEPQPGRGRLARRAVGADARHQVDVRLPGASSTPATRPRPTGSSANRFYQNISGALSRHPGVHGHREALRAPPRAATFDLVVVDTPPSRNALDFLDAPRRLARFLDHRLYRILMAPTRGVMKAASAAAQAFVRSVTKVVGGDVFDDAITFFTAFEGMERGFRSGPRPSRPCWPTTPPRSCWWRRPGATPSTRPGTSPPSWARSGIGVRALVVNRMQPRFGTGAGRGDGGAGGVDGGDGHRAALPEPGRDAGGGRPGGAPPGGAGRPRWRRRR